MKRTLLWSGLLCGLLALGIPATGQAQNLPVNPPAPGQPSPRPTVSPYMNLNRPGASPAFNYHTLVRPQLNANASVLQLQQQTQLNRQNINQLRTQPPVLETGHATGFMDLGGFFMNQGGHFMNQRGVVATPPTGATPPAAARPRVGAPRGRAPR